MATTRISECGRFVTIDDLTLDLRVLQTLAAWAEPQNLRLQDAIQVALCLFIEHVTVASVLPREDPNQAEPGAPG
jgi:hypothetical protein